MHEDYREDEDNEFTFQSQIADLKHDIVMLKDKLAEVEAGREDDMFQAFEAGFIACWKGGVSIPSCIHVSDEARQAVITEEFEKAYKK